MIAQPAGCYPLDSQLPEARGTSERGVHSDERCYQPLLVAGLETVAPGGLTRGAGRHQPDPEPCDLSTQISSHHIVMLNALTHTIGAVAVKAL
jgi:hypothetical protein